MSGGPSTTDWLEAIGACAGAGLTGGALLIAAVNYVRQTTDRHREQADRISAWAYQLEGSQVVPTALSSGICVLNTSGRAVYKCYAKVRNLTTGKPGGGRHFRVLPPGETMRFLDKPAMSLEGPPLEWAVELDFIDQAGRHWRRDVYGVLTLLHEPRVRSRRLLRRHRWREVTSSHPSDTLTERRD